MKQKSTDRRRHLLKVLVRRQTFPTHLARIEAAIGALELQARAKGMLPELAARQKAAYTRCPKDRWKDPILAESLINLAIGKFFAHEISLQEYVYTVSMVAEGVHEGRILDKKYPELERLSSEIRQVEQNHGLDSNQCWSNKEIRLGYHRLKSKWSSAEKQLFYFTLSELEGGRWAAYLFWRNNAEFERLRERGRRSQFHKGELILVLTDTVNRYELEAKAAAQSSAFTAAVTMLGAAMEGLLLLRCMRTKVKAIRTFKKLFVTRLRDATALTRWSFDNLIQVCLHAGWLPSVNTPRITIKPDDLAYQLKQMRNQIHPGNACSYRPWVEITKRDFENAELIYTTLYATVFRGAMLRRFAEPTDDANEV